MPADTVVISQLNTLSKKFRSQNITQFILSEKIFKCCSVLLLKYNAIDLSLYHHCALL